LAIPTEEGGQTEIRVTGDGLMRRLEELGKFLTDHVGVEAVQAIAFTVRPKE
jgi:hypothetical protein